LGKSRETVATKAAVFVSDVHQNYLSAHPVRKLTALLDSLTGLRVARPGNGRGRKGLRRGKEEDKRKGKRGRG